MEACAFGGRGEGQLGSMAWPGAGCGKYSLRCPVGEEAGSALIDNEIPQFSFSLSMANAFKLNALLPWSTWLRANPQRTHHFLAQVLRIWHLYCRQRDSFATERQVKNCGVLSSPWHRCMLLTPPGSCCQALHYCLPAPKVLNALALPTVGLLQEWMKHFPGQDFMNETAYVLQGKRLHAFPRLRKHMLRETCISVLVGMWRGKKKNIPDQTVPENLSTEARC